MRIRPSIPHAACIVANRLFESGKDNVEIAVVLRRDCNLFHATPAAVANGLAEYRDAKRRERLRDGAAA